jgi:hypothetical protein
MGVQAQRETNDQFQELSRKNCFLFEILEIAQFMLKRDGGVASRLVLFLSFPTEIHELRRLNLGRISFSEAN